MSEAGQQRVPVGNGKGEVIFMQNFYIFLWVDGRIYGFLLGVEGGNSIIFLHVEGFSPEKWKELKTVQLG